MRSLLLFLCFPVAAFGAAPQAVSPIRCDSTYDAVKLSSEQLASAKQTEAALAERSLTPELANVDAIQVLSLSQYERYRKSEANATAQTVAAIWQREAPSSAVAVRARDHARQQLAHTNCPAAEELYKAALEIARKGPGEGDSVTVEVMHELAMLYRAQRRFAERLALYRSIAELLRADPALGRRLPQVYLELSDLAYRDKNFKQAEQYARTAMAHLDNGAGPTSLALVPALNEAAAALYAQGQLQEGDKLRDRGRDIVRQVNSSTSIVEVQQPPPAGSVAALYKLGQIDGAIAKALQRLQVEETKLAELTATLTQLQADPASQPASASEARKRELALASRAVEFKQRDITFALADAAELYHSQERRAEAEPLYRRGFALLTESKADKSQLAARFAHGLGIILRKKGELKEAEQFQHIAYANIEAEFGPDYPDALDAQAELAHLFAAQGDLVQAAGLYTSLAAREEQRLDADRLTLSEHLMPLAALQLQQGDVPAAEANFLKVVQLWRQGGTRNDPYLMASLGSLASLYAKQGKSADAKRIETQLVALRRSK